MKILLKNFAGSKLCRIFAVPFALKISGDKSGDVVDRFECAWKRSQAHKKKARADRCEAGSMTEQAFGRDL